MAFQSLRDKFYPPFHHFTFANLKLAWSTQNQLFLLYICSLLFSKVHFLILNLGAITSCLCGDIISLSLSDMINLLVHWNLSILNFLWKDQIHRIPWLLYTSRLICLKLFCKFLLYLGDCISSLIRSLSLIWCLQLPVYFLNRNANLHFYLFLSRLVWPIHLELNLLSIRSRTFHVRSIVY